MEKIVKSTITNINRAKSKIIKKRGSAVKEIESGERLLEAPCKVQWNDDLFPLTKFSSGKEMLHKRINEISSREDVAEALASLNTTIKKAKKTGCFIATATMGDMNHPTVLHLRKFRDLFLLKRSWGASFIRYYYHYSPYPAKIIAKSRILKFASYLIIIKPLTIITKWLLQSKNN
jgi:hypothetical protein